MHPASEALEEALADLRPQVESIPVFQHRERRALPGDKSNAVHWGRGVRQPVQFAPAVGAIEDFGVEVWLELGAHPALGHSIQECLARGGKGPVLSSTRREREHESLLETAMDLHRALVPLDFAVMTPSRRLLSLPLYAWDKSRWWHESSDWREGRLGPGGRGLLEVRLPPRNPTWLIRLDGRAGQAFLKDHQVENHLVFPPPDSSTWCSKRACN